MPISNKATIVAAKIEATEGTITAIGAATDFIPVQPDFDMAPSVDMLTNDEMKNSLGMAKKITGAENPTISFSHYMKHSGTEGVEPAWGKFLKSALGNVKVASTEYQTVIGSTTTAIKVSDATNFRVGEPLLIKDATNGYSIAFVHSLDGGTDLLTLGFKLGAAPASGVSLGKAVTYYPVNDTSHPSLTVWRHMGGSDGRDMVRGAKVTEWKMTANAGELINTSFSLEGLEYYFNPIEITTGSDTLDFTDDDGTFAARVSSGWYKTPQELAAAIQTAMNDLATKTYTVVYSNSDGKFTIASSDATTLTLKWNTGTNTARSIAPKIGFSTAADSSSATTYTSATAQSYAAAYTPSYDASDAVAAKGHVVYFGDATDNVCFGPSTVEITITNTRKVIDNICSASGRSGSVITGREVTGTVRGLISKYDADKFDRMLRNVTSRFQYIGGTKTGGNWTPGKCFGVYLPYCTVTDPKIGDDESLCTIEFGISAFVPDDGSLECYVGFV